MKIPTLLTTGALLAAGVIAGPTPAAGQSALDRPPNLTGGWTGSPGTIHFNFIHRFEVSDPPLRKVSNFPTLTLATGLGRHTLAGFSYASNSDLVPAYPNEWEFFGRWAPISRRAGHVLDVSLQAGYNLAAESVDGELQVARDFGPLRLLAAGRAFSDGYRAGEERFAVSGGASVRLTPWLAVSGDYATLLDRADDERWSWGGGVQLGVPYTPHSLSVHATNVTTGTLQGTSRGRRTRWGFEYTVPITLQRYIPALREGSDDAGAGDEMGARGEAPAMEAPAGGGEMAADTVFIDIRQLRYSTEEVRVEPGTTVTWVNRDPLVHTVTSDDGAFDSDTIEPGARWSRTFPDVGAFPYHCTPHPFMTGRVVVEEPMDTMEDAR